MSGRTLTGRADEAVAGAARSRGEVPTLLAAGGMFALLLGLGAVALSLGEPVIGVHRLPAVLAEGDGLAYVVLWELRLPRLIVAVLAGAAVAVAGLLMQEALRNPLAVPELLGVSGGASLVMAMIVVWGLPVPLGLHPAAALGGALAGGAVCLAAARLGRGAESVLLIGAAASTAVQALTLAVLSTASRLQYDSLFRYLVGSLTRMTWEHVAQLLPWTLLAVPLTLLAMPVLGLLRLGDDAAASLGVRVGWARLGLIALAALLVAGVVGPCGPIAWVGFLAPLLARRLRPSADARGWLPWTALIGALVTLGADQAARLVFAPVETPLGAWTAVVGIGTGLVLLRRSARPAPAAAEEVAR
ncbi:FecCD family ABC transporter permease [Allonocardiopsis opalescens]|uniref:Iron complex transport system permease protein n=1 Tax=Allonocardiopsis opalescens TaxID=1144618 RepID=A0A2T0Q1T9_9ACTN|nr:iron ABC transporter permease [Allonocardiopsis opalescens]PRX97766.1 iron complex transport system permease protein [Allonocardiopsis opalescens]